MSSLVAALPGTQALRGRAQPPCPSKSVTHRYGPRIALDRLDLEVAQGEVLALLGPNGAGKSTTISALLGLVRPQEGRVEVLGSDPRQAVADGRVGAMLQSGSGIGLPPGVRVDDALAWSGGSTAGRRRVTRSSSAPTSVRSSAGGPTASRAARPSGSASPSRSQATPRSCSSTSPPPPWTWSPARDSGG